MLQSSLGTEKCDRKMPGVKGLQGTSLYHKLMIGGKIREGLEKGLCVGALAGFDWNWIGLDWIGLLFVEIDTINLVWA